MPVDFSEIRARREKLGLTQQEAAERAGFQGTAAKVRWHDVECGKYADPRLSTLESVARALGCRAADLIVDPPAPAGPQKRSRPSGSAGSKG